MEQTTGKFIVIDGTDGSGKGTQTKLLVQRLKKEGHKVAMLDFPQYGQPSAWFVEKYLNGKYGTADEVGPYRASIFYALDRYDAAPRIRELLDEGHIIISNRYVSASMGHQTGKIRDSAQREKFLAWLDDLEYNIMGIPRPDVQIILHMPAAIAQELVDKKGARDYIKNKKRDIHEADLEHLKNAEIAYEEIANKFSNFKLIRSYQNSQLLSIKEVHELLYAEVKKEI